MTIFTRPPNELRGEQIVFVNPKQRFKCFAVHRVEERMGQVQCLAFSPDEAYLAIGLEQGNVQLLEMKGYETPTASDPLLVRSLAVAGLSFSADSSELVVSIRSGDEVHVYTYAKPFTNLDKHYVDRPIPEVS